MAFRDTYLLPFDAKCHEVCVKLIREAKGSNIKDTILLIDRIKRGVADLLRDINRELLPQLTRDLSVACLKLQEEGENIPLGMEVALYLAAIDKYITSQLNGEEVDLDSFYEETKNKLFMSYV